MPVGINEHQMIDDTSTDLISLCIQSLMTLKIKLRYSSLVNNCKTFFFSVAHDTSNPFDTLSICGSQIQDGFVKYLMGSVDNDGENR